jgi:hypothetical protein
MYVAEQLFNNLTYKELYLTLRGISDEDLYIDSILQDDLLQEFIYLLELYNLVYISSDDRVLLSSKGETFLYYAGCELHNKHKNS